MASPVSSAKRASSAFHSRSRAPFEPPASAVTSNPRPAGRRPRMVDLITSADEVPLSLVYDSRRATGCYFYRNRFKPPHDNRRRAASPVHRTGPPRWKRAARQAPR
jgi:hypothetical protein